MVTGAIGIQAIAIARSVAILLPIAMQADRGYPDFGNHAIRLISNGVVSTLAGTGSAGFADAIGTNAAFNLPLGLAVKGTALYVADLLRGSRASSVTMVVLAHPPEKPHF